MSSAAISRALCRTSAALLAFWCLGVMANMSVASPQNTFPYDETADAESDVAAAATAAQQEGRLLMINFGANWCPDCRALATAIDQEPLASLLAEHFVMVKVDVGNWDKHQALVKRYGDPIANGIPAIAVVDRSGTVRYTTQAGELATARNMGSDELQRFFEQLVGRLQEP